MCEESQIQGKRITVVGAGVSGRALAELAAKLGAKVFVSDAKELPEETKKLFESAGIDYECGGNTERALEADEVVVSSGISPKAPIVAEALKRGMRVTGELDFVNPYLSGIVIGVTGSNGKTTTTSMIGYFLEKLGYSVMTGGNIGNAVAHAAGRDYDFIVLELSSFQLYWAREFMCDLAIVTNLAPDHIDWHGSYENYVASKANLINCLAPGGALLYNGEGEPGGGDVLLRPGVNQAEIIYVKHPRHDVAGHVRDQRHAGRRLRQHPVLGTGNGVVAGNMHIGRTRRQFPFRLGRNMVIFGFLARCGHVDVAEQLGFLGCLGRPYPGIDVIGGAAIQEIHRHHGELHACPPLHKADRVIIGNIHQLPDILLGAWRELAKKLL